MRVRHKTPTLVSMWMLDVFCCALGCVTLLWLLNTRQAGEQTAAAKSALEDLSVSRQELLAARSEIEATKVRLNSEVQKLTDQLAAARLETDETGRKLGIAQAEAKSAQELLDATKLALNASKSKLDANAKELAAAATRSDDAAAALARRQKEADELAKKLAQSTAAADDLAKLLRTKDDERAALSKRLDDADARMRAAAAKSADDQSSARGAIKDLEKRLADANANIIDLQGEKKALADKATAIQRDAENKFAGIAMTGKRVVFAIDMSGSMRLIDGSTEDRNKWPIVAETVAKVMRSIPGLEKFQVVVFSSQARWLFGREGWLTFDGEASAQQVKKALLDVTPNGDTNIYDAMDLAFKLRDDGLDTVYLFSDGLPTSGPGLSADQASAKVPLREVEKSEVLARHLRTQLNTTWNRPAGRPKVKINAVGFFYESPDVGAFLWALARENDGSFVGMSRP